jgi:hypothetical protein
MQKTVLIIQSGAMGDIFIVAPIARYYSMRGYLIYWPVRETYFNLVNEYFPYVNALLVDDRHFPKRNEDWLRSDTMHLHDIAKKGSYDLVLDLADRGDKPNEQPGETFEETKYRLAQLPIAFKNHLYWQRNTDKENDLITIVEENYDINIKKDRYIIAHLESSHGDKAKIPDEVINRHLDNRTIIEITKIRDFEIPDWYPIIAGSEEVFCVESAVHQFIDGCIHRLEADNPVIRFNLLSRSSLNPGQSYTQSGFWNKKYMK